MLQNCWDLLEEILSVYLGIFSVTLSDWPRQNIPLQAFNAVRRAGLLPRYSSGQNICLRRWNLPAWPSGKYLLPCAHRSPIHQDLFTLLSTKHSQQCYRQVTPLQKEMVAMVVTLAPNQAEVTPVY